MSGVFGRAFNDARREQGFRSQAHLDAFYAQHDHTTSCADCSRAGAVLWLADGSPQPTRSDCPEAQRLHRATLNSL